MDRPDSDREAKKPQYRGEQFHDALEYQPGSLGRSQLNAGYQTSKDESVYPSQKSKLESRRTSEVNHGYSRSRYSARPRKETSADERRYLRFPIAGADRRDGEEPKLKADKETDRSVSHTKPERGLLPLGNVPLAEEIPRLPSRRPSTSASHQPCHSEPMKPYQGRPPPRAKGRADSMSTPHPHSSIENRAPPAWSVSGPESWSKRAAGRAGTASDNEFVPHRDRSLREDGLRQIPHMEELFPLTQNRSISRRDGQAEVPPQQAHGRAGEELQMLRAPGERLGDVQVNHQHEHVHQHFHHTMPAPTSGKGPVFIRRAANGNLQFERCLKKKSHTK